MDFIKRIFGSGVKDIEKKFLDTENVQEKVFSMKLKYTEKESTLMKKKNDDLIIIKRIDIKKIKNKHDNLKLYLSVISKNNYYDNYYELNYKTDKNIKKSTIQLPITDKEPSSDNNKNTDKMINESGEIEILYETELKYNKTINIYRNDTIIEELYILSHEYELIETEFYEFTKDNICYSMLIKNSNMVKLMNTLKSTFKKKTGVCISFNCFSYESDEIKYNDKIVLLETYKVQKFRYFLSENFFKNKNDFDDGLFYYENGSEEVDIEIDICYYRIEKEKFDHKKIVTEILKKYHNDFLLINDTEKNSINLRTPKQKCYIEYKFFN